MAFAFPGSAHSDIFDSLAALADSLETWVLEPPAPWIAPADTIDLGGLFPGARLELNDEHGEITIRQPLYLHLLRSELVLHEAALLTGDLAGGWRLPETEAEAGVDTGLLLWLRTCGLPANLMAPAPDDTALVQLVLQGHSPRRWMTPRQTVCLIITHLAQSSQVYAGAMANPPDPTGGDREFYLLWTHPDEPGHHLLLWTRRTAPDHDRLVLVPFIRTDNLADLFSTTEKREPLFHLHRDR